MRFPFRLLLDQRKPWLALAILALTTPSTPALAQLIPDATLGTHSSTITTNGSVDTVNGGFRAGSNLFHSFRELNVEFGRSLYFTDPGVANILTRVTGSNPSTINGRLGVNGLANLFLINPNGIIFGAGASLDIRGSFTATTASTIKFADGSEFSATYPAASNLLTVSVPMGLQRGGNQSPARIINRGRLQVGQDLTLDADALDLQGQLQAGRNLNLLAADTVTVRDTVDEPFLAKSGGDLTVRGDRGIDILALNHPDQTAFQSGGNLALISDGAISGDARFESGGGFQMQPITQELATFTSLYDPIITSTGDVNLALNYTGPSLLIEAGGNIRIQGTVNITTPDAAAPFVGGDAVLNSQAGLILRSNQTTRRYTSNSGTVAGSSTGTGLVPAAGITLNRNVTVAPGGVVQLTADGTGSIRTQRITTRGGAITMTSGRSITTNGQTLNVSTTSGDAGSIRLTALNGNLAIGDLIANGDASSTFGDIGNGGTISLSSTNGNITTGQLQAGVYSFANSGNSGIVTLSATNGSITTGDNQWYEPRGKPRSVFRPKGRGMYPKRFKLYNDTYGHLAGDECLVKVAALVQSVVKRSDDLVARYGGEEFAVVLPNTPISGTLQIANEIRLCIQQAAIPHCKSQISRSITLSMGAACLVPTSESDITHFIHKADQALYQAKMAGRDRIVALDLSDESKDSKFP
jgi:diguanylate cyclase (GGDEF)-like protein/filamentous hemagglutinin family protein